MKSIILKSLILTGLSFLFFNPSYCSESKKYVAGIAVPNSLEERNKILPEIEEIYKKEGVKNLPNLKKLAIIYMRNAGDDFSKENIDKALDMLNLARKADPDDYQLMSSYGSALAMSAAFVGDRTDKAMSRGKQGLRYMTIAVKKAPNHVGVLMDRAFSCYFAPKFLRQIHYSIKDFNKISELVGDDWGPGFKAMIHYFLAGSYEKNKQYDLAKKHYKIVTEIKGTAKSKNHWIRYSENKLEIL